ncbi:ead/Ea22-like family protein [Escherichia coli]|nr:ead/Ea22-like family protein [Escherichia coli]MCV8190197.1 ead/Ea22-like family protein [Escherichia coli]MCV8232858.1 ead/Ea22-like family protein [Escherichia coli]MCV8242620.1 ead/Ea22-like family protein [Escherichia coli]
MSKIDYQKLREIAEKTKIAGEAPVMPFDQRINALNDFMKHFSPDIALALLDELERNQQYIKSRDQENEDIALTVGKLLIENGQLVADTLRHLADNEIDSDYFAITSTNENGTEIDHEMAITDYALQAAGTVDELVAALESAEKRIAELSASHSKLRDTMAGIHNTIRMDGGYTPLAAILNAAKRAYEESASAAGIRIKGGE